MAKKTQTTGGPKQKVIPIAPANKGGQKPKEYLTRAEREAQIQRLIVRVTIATLAIVLVLVLATFIYDQVIRPNQVVVTVNGENITVGEFQNRYLFERARITQDIQTQLAFFQQFGFTEQDALNQLSQSPPYDTYFSELNFPDQLGRRVINEMVNDLLIAQEARSRNITVNTEAVQNSIDDFFGYDPTEIALIGAEPTATIEPTITPTPYVSPTPSPTPTLTATPTVNPEATSEAMVEATDFPTPTPAPTLSQEERRANYDNLVANFRDTIQTLGNIGPSEIDAFFQRRALREALRDSIASEVQNPVLYANVRHILVETEEEALDILEALQNGESFSQLAQAKSLDNASAQQGGELSWSPVGLFVPEFAEAITNATIGELVGPVQTEFGYHIIQVRAREERDAEEDVLTNIKESIFNRWLTEHREAMNAQINITDLWLDNLP